MAGLTMDVSFLIEVMLANIGYRGQDDLKYYWFETIYKTIREQPWPWNYTDDGFVTQAPVTPVEVFTWVAGNNSLSTVGPLTLTWLSTGRVVEIDNRIYRIREIDPVGLTVTLDRSLATTEATGVALTFYRDIYGINTSSIRRIDIDGKRVSSTSLDYWKRLGGKRYEQYVSAQPICYIILDNYKLPPPKYAPKLDASALDAQALANGEYEYFWTFFDLEARMDSPPGPTFKTTISGGAKNLDIGYDNPFTANVTENLTYTMRLWRTKVTPTGTRSTAYLVGSKNPLAVAIINDALPDNKHRANERYYAGDRTVVQWRSFPDAVYSLDLEYIESYEGRPDPTDKIYLGINNTVPELLSLGASTFVELSNRDPNAQMQAIIKFRQQLAYLVKKTPAGNADDPGLEEIYRPDGITDSENLFDPTRTYVYRD